MAVNGEVNGHAAQSSIFDSLPYYDNDLEHNPVLRQKAEQELAKENKPRSSLHPNVPPEITLFQDNPLLRAELERVEKHQPIPPLDAVRYQVPAPPANASEEEWIAALNNAKSQLEHLRIRQDNLALLSNYGANSWRVSNYLLEETAKGFEKALEELKNRTTDVNRERKQSQTRLGSQLSSLETRWTELISNLLQIELANVALEAELEELKKREEELSSL